MNKEPIVSNSQWIRLRLILAKLRELKAGARVTKGALAVLCECGPKSIQRDMGVLIGNGWQIEYDQAGYYLEAEGRGKLLHTDNKQMAALVLAGCSVDKNLMENFPAAVSMIRGELLSRGDWNSLNYDMESSSIVVEKCGMRKGQLEVFGALARSIVDGIAVNFDYRTVGRFVDERRAVFPLILKQKDGVWYLIGYDLDREAIRIFTAAKVKGVISSERSHERPSAAVYKEAEARGEFSIWDAGGGHTEVTAIKVRLWEYAADYVKNRKIHGSQKMEISEDGSVLLQLKTSDVLGVSLWLRRFLTQVEILEPASLRRDFANDLRAALANHG